MRRLLLALLGLFAGLAPVGAAGDDALRDMLAFDAVYIPALAASGAAAQSAASADRALAAQQRLAAAWPELEARLREAWPTDRAWLAELADVERRITLAGAESGRGAFGLAHERLEEVRVTMMQARRRLGMDYFVDALTLFHEPMEAIALAGATLKPQQLDAARRAELERAFTRARTLWVDVERRPIDAARLALSPAREAQLRRGIADETAALERLSAALRARDAERLLDAAAAIKPPFVRALTAFGLAEGETRLP